MTISTDKDREITPEEAFNLHQNAQAVSLLVSSLSSNEFNKVNGIESAKQVWETLIVSFEGDKSVKKGNIELLMVNWKGLCSCKVRQHKQCLIGS